MTSLFRKIWMSSLPALENKPQTDKNIINTKEGYNEYEHLLLEAFMKELYNSELVDISTLSMPSRTIFSFRQLCTTQKQAISSKLLMLDRCEILQVHKVFF